MLLPLLLACINPTMLGAVPNDSKPDNVAIQLAIDKAVKTHAAVCFGPGVFDLGPPVRTNRRIGSIIISGGPVTIRGMGDKTVLRLSGDGNRRDWRGIHLLDADNVILEDFVIDGLAAVNTEEQTHLVEIGPGSRDVVIVRMTFGPMRQPTERIGQGIGGDCLRLIGSANKLVEDVIVADSTFTNCDRSGIAFQRGLRGITIVRDTIINAGDQAIDFEPTGKGAIDNVAIVRVTIKKPPDSQGEWAMTIVGTGNELANRIVVADSKIEGGGIFMKNVHDVTLIRNEIVHGSNGGSATINVIRRANDLRIIQNKITRPASSKPGPVIRASDNKGFRPYGITIANNQIIQETKATVIGSISAGGMSIRRNKITYGGGDDTIAIVTAAAVVGDLANISITDNTITGKAAAVLVVQSRNNAIGRIAVRDNVTTNIAGSVRCNGSGFSRIALDKVGMSRQACPTATLVPAGKSD